MELRNPVSSSYWKIPDNSEYLSAVATHDTAPLIAVASASMDSNLFIYELDVNGDNQYRTNVNRSNFASGRKNNQPEKAILTHHQTITLPGIHSLAWMPQRHCRSLLAGRPNSNVLVSGHDSGIIHLTLLPDPYSDYEPAQIVRRFNHNKHVRPSEVKSSRVRSIMTTSERWMCCPESSIMTMYNQYLFVWDPFYSDTPLLKKKCKGSTVVDPAPLRDGIVSLGGSKGISIMDVRVKNATGLSPPHGNDSAVNALKWSPHDENTIASVHDYTTCKLWDIRAGKPLATLDGHTDRINDLSWSPIDSNEIRTASSDGTIRMWNIQNCIDLQSQPLVPPPRPSTYYHNAGSDLEWMSKPWKQHRQRVSRYDDLFSHMSYVLESSRDKNPSTTVVSHSREFIAISPLQIPRGHGISGRLISIDNSGFFGLHTKFCEDEAHSAAAQLSRATSSAGSASAAEDDLFSSAESIMTHASSPDLSLDKF
ncbi:hypothetical protein TRVA0_028S00342 [Trichomonascus vanleenenianus]|uniref:WD40 repeat domain-containing protein n=1 Tax=Trichomonascus vanleenenianus TaxID=2268995 RepID=UPI003EC98697